MFSTAAHVEAKGARNCIALVKLMGRDSGFIAAGATLASGEVNFYADSRTAFFAARRARFALKLCGSGFWPIGMR